MKHHSAARSHRKQVIRKAKATENRQRLQAEQNKRHRQLQASRLREESVKGEWSG